MPNTPTHIGSKSWFIATIVLLLALGVFPARGQTVDYPFGVGTNIGFTQYTGDLGSSIFDRGAGNKGLNIHFGYYLNPSFDLVYNLDLTKVAFENQDVVQRNPLTGKQFENLVFGNTLFVRYKFANGYLLREGSDLDIYLSTGGSFMFSSDRIAGTSDRFLAVPMGMGFQLMILPEWSLNYQILYFRTFSDSFDGFFIGQGNRINDRDHDDLMIQTLGVTWHFGSQGKVLTEPDSDSDGVPDHVDKCPQIPGSVSTQGCPDRDGDGISDFEDMCPGVPGLISAKGCPDRDGDGIPDSQDGCPYVPGPASSNGCPDSDGDGVPDYRDTCPEVPGAGFANGCPNGVRVAAPVAVAEPTPAAPPPVTTEPDKDGDGIPDSRDKCPETRGVVANGGCPEIDRSVETALANIVKNIQFETASDRIARSSQASLTELVEILKKFPETKLSIEGHTDAAGNANRNMSLSQRRADSVKKFLSDNGITPSRLTAKGFGQTQPVATNDTAEGRAQNRRVDLKISY